MSPHSLSGPQCDHVDGGHRGLSSARRFSEKRLVAPHTVQAYAPCADGALGPEIDRRVIVIR